MKKIILIDGNNFLFRSYYANGTKMKNSKGFPTGAIYGFITMLNKIIKDENPEYMAVAFDIGKNFRHEKYPSYKAGRKETPEDLLKQFPVAKEVLKAQGIKYIEVENYEADDIIGTLAKRVDESSDFKGLIVSSDKDLLQLISKKVHVKHLKPQDYILFDEEQFKNTYGFEPIKIIDLKAIQGDASDNIPGVKGIGEKGALELIRKYNSLDNVYQNIDEITGKNREKLINDKGNAYFSYELATIYKKVPLNITLEDTKLNSNMTDQVYDIYKDLEFYSLIKDYQKEEIKPKTITQIITNLEDLNINDNFAYYIECDEENYHEANILGMGVYDGTKSYFIQKELIEDFFQKFNYENYTYDLKKNIYLLNSFKLNTIYDLMLSSYLLGNNKDDISYLLNNSGLDIPLFDSFKKSNFNDLENIVAKKAEFIYITREEYINNLKMENMYELYTNIEFPLIKVLAKMELNGVKVNPTILKEMKETIDVKINRLEKDICEMAGMEFNVSSPKQLGDVLFEKLNLPFAKKTKTGYKTDVSILNKLIGHSPIIPAILEHRNLKKLSSTYLEGLDKYIKEDGKIHTIFKQNLTRTGRLSSIEPNLQNIPVRDELGRKIRKAFLPSYDEFLCADYSQIELRILAHISSSEELIKAFNDGADIHTKVAADIYGVSEIAVTKEMRKNAKAVIFGIVYGISGYGLSEGTTLSPKEAKLFIEKYYQFYPGVKKYMDNIIKEAYDTGEVRTLFNRKRVIEELNNPMYMIRASGERIALNTPIQGTSADIIKMAMIKIDEEFTKNNIESKMILQVHDELIFDIKDSEKEKITKIVKDIMENIYQISVPLKVEINYGKDWYEA